MRGDSRRRWCLFVFTLAFVLLTLNGRASAAGQYLAEFPLPPLYYGFFAITTGPDGNLWFASYIADETGHAKIGRVTSTGQLAEFVVPTLHPGISAITAGPDGKIWFTEELAGKIGRIDLSGLVEEFALPTRDFGSYSQRASPVDIVSGADGNVWFTEGSFNKIGSMDPLGQLTEYSLPDFGSLPNPLVSRNRSLMRIAEASADL